MSIRQCLSVAAVLCVGAGVAGRGQSPLPPARAGLVGGMNLAKFDGPNVTDVENRKGFVGGLSLVTPFAPNFAVQLEALYSMKGGVSTSGTPSADEFTLKMDFLEIPLLLRAEAPVGGGITPFGYAGAAVDFRVRCNLEGRSAAGTESLGCEEVEQGLGSSFSKFDWGPVFGGGLAFDLSGHTVSIGARYEIGMRNLLSEGDSKHRVLSFLVSLEAPLPRKPVR